MNRFAAMIFGIFIVFVSAGSYAAAQRCDIHASIGPVPNGAYVVLDYSIPSLSLKWDEQLADGTSVSRELELLTSSTVSSYKVSRINPVCHERLSRSTDTIYSFWCRDVPSVQMVDIYMHLVRDQGSFRQTVYRNAGASESLSFSFYDCR